MPSTTRTPRSGAWSADHVQYASAEGILALAQAGTPAVVLPGTSLYTRLPYANGPRLRDSGAWIAIATDHNPGSCVIDNLPMIATLAALHCQLTVVEALAGVTVVAARALNLHHRKGALTPGFDADLVVYPAMTIDEWIADFGRTRPRQVWVAGNNRKPHS